MPLFSLRVPPTVRAYNTFVRPRRWYRSIPPEHPWHFRFQYVAFRAAYAREFPWRFVLPGQTVLQVSSDKDLISAGRSHALMCSALVGPTGRVIAVEPEPENAAALRSYVAAHHIANMTVVERAIWSERGPLKFTVRPGRPGWHRATTTVDDASRAKYDGRLTIVEVAAETIDGLVEEFGLSDLAFVNATINGCEMEAARGMTATLARGTTFAFPIQNARTASSPLMAMLEAAGYTVLLEHAPVSIAQQQFIVACAIRNPPPALLARYEEVRVAVAEDVAESLILTPVRSGQPIALNAFRPTVRWWYGRH